MSKYQQNNLPKKCIQTSGERTHIANMLIGIRSVREAATTKPSLALVETGGGVKAVQPIPN